VPRHANMQTRAAGIACTPTSQKSFLLKPRRAVEGRGFAGLVLTSRRGTPYWRTGCKMSCRIGHQGTKGLGILRNTSMASCCDMFDELEVPSDNSGPARTNKAPIVPPPDSKQTSEKSTRCETLAATGRGWNKQTDPHSYIYTKQLEMF
jgi:hypothetical protein